MITDALSPDLAQFVHEELAAGKYESADQVLCEAVRLLRDRERRLEALRKDIDVGLDQLARGEGIKIKDEEQLRAFFDRLEASGQRRLQEKQSAT